MTIRNKKAYMDALWDWGFLDRCFGKTRIKVSDVDGAVERNGHVLFIEAKPPFKDISVGQAIMFSQFAQNGFTVLVVWGPTNEPAQMQVWIPHVANPLKRVQASQSHVQEFVRKWFVWADQIGSKQQLDKKGRWPMTLELKANGEDDE